RPAAVIARIAVCGAAAAPFDYWIPAGLDVVPGSVVRVTLNRRSVTGVVVALDPIAEVAPEKLRTVDEVVDLPPLPADVQAVAAFVADYYHEPLGAVLGNAVPPLAKTRARRAPPTPVDASERFALNAAQAAAAARIEAAAGAFTALVLSGVTGSGKTAVYLAAAERAIAQGGQALILVP